MLFFLGVNPWGKILFLCKGKSISSHEKSKRLHKYKLKWKNKMSSLKLSCSFELWVSILERLKGLFKIEPKGLTRVLK